MKLEVLTGLKAQIIECNRVLVTSVDGRPLAGVSEYAPGAFVAVHAAEESFERTLKTLGIDRTSITTVISKPRLIDFGL